MSAVGDAIDAAMPKTHKLSLITVTLDIGEWDAMRFRAREGSDAVNFICEMAALCEMPDDYTLDDLYNKVKSLKNATDDFDAGHKAGWENGTREGQKTLIEALRGMSESDD